MGNTFDTSSRRQSTNSIESKSLALLYEACRVGNDQLVHQLLPSYSHFDLNQPIRSENGNTCLHIATSNGHDSIVELLLEHGCYRSLILNNDRCSAFDFAKSSKKESTLSLFYRHDSNDSSMKSSSRFHDSNINECFDVVQVDELQTSEKSLPNVQTFTNEKEQKHEIEYSASSKAMCQSRLARFCVNHFHQDEPLTRRTIVKNLKDLLKTINNENSSDSIKAKYLFEQFEKTNDSIKELIHLYTLETDFYRSLKTNCLPLAIPLFIHLPQLKERYFQGRVYRGMRMSYEQIHLYQQAMKSNGTLFQTRTFSSTSINRSIAEQFAFWKTDQMDHDLSVLFIFDFPQICDQAINLSRISDDEPSLSEYENEKEVLILPWTLFEVTRVRRASNEEDLTTIHLTNRIIPRKHLLSTFKWSYIEMKNQIRNDGKITFNCAFQKYNPTFTQTK